MESLILVLNSQLSDLTFAVKLLSFILVLNGVFLAIGLTHLVKALKEPT